MQKHNVEHGLDFSNVNTIALGITELNTELEINFNKNIFCTPSGIAMFSSLANYKKDLLVFNYTDIKFIRYLLRNNFFLNLNIEIEEDFRRHDATANMLECTTIKQDGDPDLIDSKLEKILTSHIHGKKNLVLGVLLTTYEIVDNILEHSMGDDFVISNRSLDIPGYVSAQYYTKNNIVEIGISDMGKGIVDTMSSESEYLLLDRKDILFKAFELNTTRHKKIMPTRGNGLAKLKEFVLASNGSIRCRTNEFIIFFNNDFPEGRIQSVQPVQGTHFEIKIGCKCDIDTKPIFNTDISDYEDNDELEDFFD
ncbi:hypothetical protein [Arcobacter sp. YIC-310]|uniref:hypothetical protein n=1 Tax=Arcobacter sp. YIC-310 TaxID=3376632 RepID=UPI003C1A30F8